MESGSSSMDAEEEYELCKECGRGEAWIESVRLGLGTDRLIKEVIMTKQDRELREFLAKQTPVFDRLILEQWEPDDLWVRSACNENMSACYVCGRLGDVNQVIWKAEKYVVCDGCGVRMGILKPL